MSLHICTQDAFFVDAIPFDGECWICLVTGQQEMGWTGVRCTKCRNTYDSSMPMGALARKRREYLGLTRKEMAARLGYRPATIKRYEFVSCSYRYFDKTGEVVGAML